MRVDARRGGRWRDESPPGNLYTHTPQIYARGDDVYVFLGHDARIRFGYVYKLRGQPWSRYVPLTAQGEGTFDGSASIRWNPFGRLDRVIDVAFFDEDRFDDGRFLPELYYMGIAPARR